MQVHQYTGTLPAFNNAVITIGTFDGVHLGHQQIIAQLKEEAAATGGETVIITFDPHPRKMIPSRKPVNLLNLLPEKLRLLAAMQVDHVVIVPFNENFLSQPPEDYIEDFLFKKFHPNTIIIGYDHRFGKDRRGDYHLLEDYGKKLGFQVKEIPERILNETIISSTKIREALLAGDINAANSYLGYTYFFEGTVMEGNKLGRTIGYPTANLAIADEEKLIPANGVYAVNVEQITAAQPEPVVLFKGMMNIGMRPTINGTNRTIEVNIFDFDKDIYGATLRIHIKQFLRSEVKFSGLDALKEQLAKDKLHAIRL